MCRVRCCSRTRHNSVNAKPLRIGCIRAAIVRFAAARPGSARAKRLPMRKPGFAFSAAHSAVLSGTSIALRARPAVKIRKLSRWVESGAGLVYADVTRVNDDGVNPRRIGLLDGERGLDQSTAHVLLPSRYPGIQLFSKRKPTPRTVAMYRGLAASSDHQYRAGPPGTTIICAKGSPR